jgi:predicted nucleic acid-binding protein
MEEGFDLGGGPYLSEDFQHGRDLAGAQVVNPFR